MTNFTPPPPPPPPAPPAKAKGRGPAIIAIAAGLVIVVGIAVGSAIVGLRGASQSAPSPSVVASSQSAPSGDPTETASTFDPDETDFLIDIKVLKKECFGSAGCNVTFRIKPSYIGADDLPDVGKIEVSYKIKGGEGPLENTFTVDADGTAHFDSEELISTKSSHSKLEAVVTDVEYDPNA